MCINIIRAELHIDWNSDSDKRDTIGNWILTTHFALIIVAGHWHGNWSWSQITDCSLICNVYIIWFVPFLFDDS